MFIKEIKLSGFKSYKEETVVSELSNGLNIIVGRNGSGKSNIFSAIEFALTLEYNRCLKPDVRNLLVHQARNKQDPAYVEIVFDNSDKKLPVDDSTVTFRRVISTKKDRFLVNGRELVNAKQFLDAAGFTNPYFIVKQGKIHDLALATDAARLKVITDVTGANAYDIRITDCRRFIKDAEAKEKEIKTEVEDLQKRRESLEGEVVEHRRFMKRDQAKRAIEFILHTKKIQEIEQKINNLETVRKASNERQKPARESLEKVERDIQIYKREVAESELKIKQLQDLKNDYEMSKNKLASDLAYRKQELEDLKNKEITINNERTTASTDADEISKYEDLLKKAETELSRVKEEKETLFIQKCQLDSRVSQYREKELMKASAKNKAGQRSQVENKLNELTRNLIESKSSLELQTTSKQELEESLKKETERVANLRNDFSQFVNDENAICQRLSDGRAEEQKLKSRMGTVWRQSSENDQILAQTRERLARFDEEWKKRLGSEIYQGHRSVKKILDGFKYAGTHENIIKGYYGLVCEIVDCDPKLDMAVEAAAGSRLVYHVVQSKEIAEGILNEFNAREMPGVVNFIPINGLKTSQRSQLSGLNGAKPLVDLIQFPNTLATVSDFVLGNTLLCETFEIATDMMRAHNLQCVTLDGNKVSKVGVMTGGYHSRRPQKLELQRAKSSLGKELVTLSEKKKNLDLELNQLKQESEQCKRENEKYRIQKLVYKENKRCVLNDIETTEKKVSKIKDSIKASEKSIVALKAAISIMEEKEKMLKVGSVVSDDIMEAVQSFRAVIIEHSMAEKEFMMKQKEKNALNVKLNQLRKRYYTLMKISPPNSESIDANYVTRLSEDISSLSAQVSEVQKKIDRASQDLSRLQKMVSTKQKSLEELTTKEKNIGEQLMKICNELDSFASNHEHWLKKLEEQKAIGSNLGSVPSNMEKFESLSEEDLYKKLRELNIKLKDAVKVGVNQKAIQQYDELKEKCDLFENRMIKYKEDKKNMLEFLRGLGAKKGEAMLQNVRLIQEQFQTIFCTIVPQGNAELVFYGQDISIDHVRDINDDDLREAAGANVFEGVKVCVNFVGKQLHSIRSLAQLSGGQKAVIALCLILAIQTIDPAPFYLFDEVDQALDTAYRDAVAKLIGEMSMHSQFICTTFRKELIAVADKMFGVSFENRCSHIQLITEGQALSFVENDYSPMDSASISPNGSYCHSNSAA